MNFPPIKSFVFPPLVDVPSQEARAAALAAATSERRGTDDIARRRDDGRDASRARETGIIPKREWARAPLLHIPPLVPPTPTPETQSVRRCRHDRCPIVAQRAGGAPGIV